MGVALLLVFAGWYSLSHERPSNRLIFFIALACADKDVPSSAYFCGCWLRNRRSVPGRRSAPFFGRCLVGLFMAWHAHFLTSCKRRLGADQSGSTFGRARIKFRVCCAMYRLWVPPQSAWAPAAFVLAWDCVTRLFGNPTNARKAQLVSLYLAMESARPCARVLAFLPPPARLLLSELSVAHVYVGSTLTPRPSRNAWRVGILLTSRSRIKSYILPPYLSQVSAIVRPVALLLPTFGMVWIVVLDVRQHRAR